MTERTYKKSKIPFVIARIMRWLITHILYTVRPAGKAHVPFRGPALLVSNRITPAHGFLIEDSMKRPVFFVVTNRFDNVRKSHWLLRLLKTIPVYVNDREDSDSETVKRIREKLKEGHAVCIFAEEGMHVSGNPVLLRRDLTHVVEGLNLPVIPVYFDQIPGNVVEEKAGKFSITLPGTISQVVSVIFGEPLSSSAGALEVKQAVMELGIEAARLRRKSGDLLQSRFIQSAKKRWAAFCMADSTGRELNFGKVFIGSMAIARLLKQICAEDRMVGIMLPAAVAGALTNVAVMMAGKIPVNLNFIAGSEAISSAIQQCDIRTIVTSRKFLEKTDGRELEGMVFLEDLMKRISSFQKLYTALIAFLLPVRLLQNFYNPNRNTPDDLATVIFSSGTTGIPKGIMLSHHNIISNIESFAYALNAGADDRLMAILPFFHSLGCTGTIWFPLLCGVPVIYHPSPMDAKTIGDLIEKYRVTISLGAPTFLGAQIRKIPPRQFSALRYAIAGAEKLRESVRINFKNKFGLELMEGYGCTEMAPVISVNVLDKNRKPERQTGSKPGTVGYPIPGVVAKVVHPETGVPLPPNSEGLLLLKGPNRMIGYLNQPEKTKEALQDGWYVSGDVASIDEDGFIRITDRITRFSKIGGEMIPHGRVEEEAGSVISGSQCVVTSIPDEKKGECLVLLYVHDKMSPAELWNKLAQSCLPKLWVPRRDNIYSIKEIPAMGTGKVDLIKVKKIALECAKSAKKKNVSKGTSPVSMTS